jgi:hypothetical protein
MLNERQHSTVIVTKQSFRLGQQVDGAQGMGALRPFLPFPRSLDEGDDASQDESPPLQRFLLAV